MNITLLSVLLATALAGEVRGAPPVRDPAVDGYAETRGGITNLYSQEMLLRCVTDGGSGGLAIDLSRETTLLDGTAIEPSRIAGRAWIAPYPFEGFRTEWDVYQFLASSAIREGRAELPVGRLSNEGDPDWAQRGQIVIRLELSLSLDGPDRALGTYEFLAGFTKEGDTYRKVVTVTEGPFLGLIRSDAPDRIVISLRTEPEAAVTVVVWRAGEPRSGGQPSDVRMTSQFESAPARKHEIPITGLEPDSDYSYRVEAAGWRSGDYSFHTAPRKGEGRVRFGFSGDSRQGVGGGAKAFMGVDALILDRELQEGRRNGAAFWIQGGDLVNGYTTDVDDFRRNSARSSGRHRPSSASGRSTPAWETTMPSFAASRRLTPGAIVPKRSCSTDGRTRPRARRRSSRTSS